MAAHPTRHLKAERKDGVLWLTLNRPGSANALSPTLVEALIEKFQTLGAERLIVLRGEGKHFCSGFDLSDLDKLTDADLLWRFLRIEVLLQRIYHAPIPVVGLAQGQAVGAGADLFAACWRRVATMGSSFRFPGWNFELALGTRRLTRLVGLEAARDVLIDTKVLSATEARLIGLASDLAPLEDWPAIVEGIKQRASTLSPTALSDMLSLTVTNSNTEDLATIVRTAGRPGLKDRIISYRGRLKAAKS